MNKIQKILYAGIFIITAVPNLLKAESLYVGGIINNNAHIVINGSANIINVGNYISSSEAVLKIAGTGKLNLSGDFSNNNLSLNPIDPESTGSIEFNGTGLQSIGGSKTTTFYGLIMNNSTGLNLDKDIINERDLTFVSGKINALTNNITFGPASNILGSGGYIIACNGGTVSKKFDSIGSFQFPIADNTGTEEFSPISLDFTAGTFNNGAVTVSVTDDKLASASLIANLSRYWNISQTGISDYSCDISANYADADINGDEGKIWSAYYDGAVLKNYAQADSGLNRINATITNFGTGGLLTGNYESPPVTFTEITSGIVGVAYSGVEWGDYDNDGDFDILLTGSSGAVRYSKIYRNDSGIFTDILAPIVNIYRSSVSWGDYDNDGDLDILAAGNTETSDTSAKIYRNDSGIFTEIMASIEGVSFGTTAWGDYDSDGDLDILITGRPGAPYFSRVYRNDSGTFTNINADLIGVYLSSVDWGDYDNDGDLDILLTGDDNSAQPVSKIYRNDSGTFIDTDSALSPVGYGSSCDWGDYDNDGDLDFVLSGDAGSIYISKIYRNDSGIFTDINAGITGVRFGSAKWGDFDNDGDLDLFLAGDTGSGASAKIYRNDYGIFTVVDAGFTGVFFSSADLGDYDNDGDLDILMTGHSGYAYTTKIYRNNCITPNAAPQAPSDLVFIQDQNGMHFSFDAATDSETSTAGLTYNIDINIGDGAVKSASSDLSTGYKRVPSMGNIQKNTSYTLDVEVPAEMIPQQLFDMVWKVQAVDNCFAGSAFASKNDTVMNRELITVPKEIMLASDALTWEYFTPADSIASYTMQLSDDSLFTEYYEKSFPIAKNQKTSYFGVDLQSLDVFDSLEHNGKYFWRVKPEHLNPSISTVYKKVPDIFIYDPVYSAPSPFSIAVEGNYITLTWGAVKEAEKGTLYNVYGSDDPHAVFPSGWTLLISNLNAIEWTVKSTAAKKFYCVTAVGSQ